MAEAEKQVRTETKLPDSFWKWLGSKPDIRTEAQVKNPARVMNFSEENSWSISELGSAQINDNNLRATPGTGQDHFATFHDTSAEKINYGYANAVFVDAHVERVSAYPVGNTFALSWPGGSPLPNW